MSIIADTHVHVYDCHNPVVAMASLVSNLGRLSGSATRAALLTERKGDFFFKGLRIGSTKLEGGQLAVASSGDEGALVLSGNDGPGLMLLAGRQFVSTDRLEVLALLTEMELESDLSTTDLVKAVREQGGVPVLSWAPGKWLGQRGRIVRELIESAAPGELLIGDTVMRPRLAREPALMALAREKGLGVLCGSDPFPFQGDESLMGTYGSLIEGELDVEHPVGSLRTLLQSPGLKASAAGVRCGAAQVFVRLLRHKLASG